MSRGLFERTGHSAARTVAWMFRRSGIVLRLTVLIAAAFYLYPFAETYYRGGGVASKATVSDKSVRSPAVNLKLEGQVSQILIVNMDGQEHMFEQLVRHLRHIPELLTVPILRIPGVDATRLDLHSLLHHGKLSPEGYGSVIQTRPVHGHHLTLGAIGCYMAHINAWTEVAQSGRTTLVLEDDVRLLLGADPSRFFGQLVQRVLPNAAMIYLGNIIGEAVMENMVDPDAYFWRMVGGHYGTYAYIVTPTAARILLQHAYPITHQVDSNIIETCIANKLLVYNSRTTIVSVDNSPSRTTRVQRYTQPELAIPRTIHFIWFGGPPPAHVSETMAQWLSVNPGWEARMWTDGDMPSSFSRMYPNEAFTDLREKSDIARYQIIEQYGGVYFDIDFLPLRPIEDILRGVSAFVAYENAVNLANSPIGAVPHHPFLRRVIAELPARRIEARNISVNVRTGPYFLRDMVLLYRLYHDDLTVFSDQVFFPFYFDEPDPGPPYGDLHYAVHKWHPST